MKTAVSVALMFYLLSACGGHAKLGETCSDNSDCQGDARCAGGICVNFCYTTCEVCREFVYYCGSPKATRLCPLGNDCLSRCASDGWEANISKAPIAVRAVLIDGVTVQVMAQFCQSYSSPTDRLDSYEADMSKVMTSLRGPGL